MWHEWEREMQERARVGRRRELRVPREGMLDAASNDYLGLARHPETIEGACSAAREFGGGARASRLVSGNFSLLGELETRLAKFKQTEAALVFSSGFAANVGVLPALANSETLLCCHKRNHASLLDGCRLAEARGAQTRFWETTAKLESLLARSGATRRIVVADGVFSMDGDVLPLPEVLALCETYGAVLVLDDAHGTGVMGASGRGAEEHFGLTSERILTIGTLSKSLGAQGGFVCGPRVAIDFLLGSAPSFIYSTGLNPAAVGAALASLRVLEREPERPLRCRENARVLAERLRVLGFDARSQGAAIVPVIVGDEHQALALSAQLEARGVWCPAIRPPTVARGTSRLRLAASSEWGEEELEKIVGAFEKCID